MKFYAAMRGGETGRVMGGYLRARYSPCTGYQCRGERGSGGGVEYVYVKIKDAVPYGG